MGCDAGTTGQNCHFGLTKWAYSRAMTVTSPASREDLYVPDRFEGLREAGTGALRSIVLPVQHALEAIDERFVDIRSAGRGSLMILRGETGAGKSTFLDTVGLFRRGVVTDRIVQGADLVEALEALTPTEQPRVIVFEGREALGRDSRATLEAALHALNYVVRSPAGRDTLFVWPTNTDPLTDLLVEVARNIGDEALFEVGEPVERFTGPSRAQFVTIAERTVAALNEGASLAALGISQEQAERLTEDAATIGRYLALVRRTLNRNTRLVRGLLPAEQFRLWTLVIAGNDPEGDVAALTRGPSAYADIDRLMSSTGANIVKELKKQPDVLGILGSVLDARILHLDMVTMLAIAREYGDGTLHGLMRAEGMSTQRDRRAVDRLKVSELGLILQEGSLGTRKRGSKPGSSTRQAFGGLTTIARTNDGACNRAIGEALVAAGLASEYDTERDLGTDLSFASDLYVMVNGEPLRIEVMWRNTTSRAEIANYVLVKLGNYSRAIGLRS